jgi:hypothetical protein
MHGKVAQFQSFRTKRALMCKIHDKYKVLVLKHVLCSFTNVSYFFHIKMFNIVVTKKFIKLLTIDLKYTYVQFLSLGGTVTSTTNELPFALRNKAYFVVPIITFLTMNPVMFFHTNDSVIIDINKETHSSTFAGNFLVTISLYSVLASARLI